MRRCQKVAVLSALVCLLIGGGWWSIRHLWSARNAKPPVATPRLACSEPVMDVGETGVLLHKHSFTLSNLSSTRVRVSEIGHSCNCLKTRVGKSILEPGESTNLEAEMEVRPQAASSITHFSSEMWVYVNGEQRPDLGLRIQGVFIPVAYFAKQQIVIKAPFNIGEPFSQDVEVFVNRGKGTEITSVSTQGPLDFQATIKEQDRPRKDGYERAVVRVSGKLARGVRLPESIQLVVRTNSKELPELLLPITVLSASTEQVEIRPDKLAFGVLGPDDRKTLTTTVRWPRDGGYTFKKAYASGKGIDVQVGKAETRADKVAVPITCGVDGSTIKGAIVQDLIVQLAVRNHTETYNLPVSGFVKAATATTSK